MRIALSLLFILTLLTGFIYPMMVTGIAQLLFPWEANGSVIHKDNIAVGSLLIEQNFTDPKYFWGRPSPTSNMSPSNPQLLATVKNRISNLYAYDPQHHIIPVELVTASASGLDPDISPAAAYYEIPRIAKARGLPAIEIRSIVNSLMIERPYGFLGEPRLNVLELNLVLDNLGPPHD
jgi:K+-transporting ATPase ATPase C chain